MITFTSRPCPVCDNTNKKLLTLIDDVLGVARIHCVKCNCAFFASKPRFKPVYDLKYNLHFFREGDLLKAKIMAEKVATFARSLPQPVSILEAGVGNGFTLANLKIKGLNAEGVDLTPEHCDFLQKYFNIKVCGGGFENMTGSNIYDIIYSSHVIEHFFQPLNFILTAKRLLKNKGYIIIDTPDLDYSNNLDPNWHHFKTRHLWEHQVILSEKAILTLAKRAGLRLAIFEQHRAFNSFQATLTNDN